MIGFWEKTSVGGLEPGEGPCYDPCPLVARSDEGRPAMRV